MAWTGSKAAADLGSLLGLATGRPGRVPRGCWPGEEDKSGNRPGDAKGRRGCWPDASDLPTGDIRPADAIRKIMRGRRP